MVWGRRDVFENGTKGTIRFSSWLGDDGTFLNVKDKLIRFIEINVPSRHIRPFVTTSDTKKYIPQPTRPDSSGINAMRWINKALAAFIRTDSGETHHDEAKNRSLQKNKKFYFIL